MPWGVAAAAVGAAGSYAAANKAADGQANASAGNNALSQSQFDRAEALNRPFHETGTRANTIMDRQLQGDFSDFYESPGYQFRLNQGQNLIENSALAGGMGFSGRSAKSLIDYGQGMASNEYGNYVNQLNNLASRGQNAANQTGYAGQNMTNSMMSNNQLASDARGSAYLAQGDIVSGLAGGIGNAFQQSGYRPQVNQQNANLGGTNFNANNAINNSGSYQNWFTPNYNF